MIDEQHKSKKLVTQREVNSKQVVPQIKQEKEQVTHTLSCICTCILHNGAFHNRVHTRMRQTTFILLWQTFVGATFCDY